MRKLLSKLLPFLILGIVIVAFIAGMILSFYLLVYGALVGLILFAYTWIKEKFFPSKHLSVHRKTNQPNQQPGRTFEHDDKDK